MTTCAEFAVGAPTLTLPRKRERGSADIGARESTPHGRSNELGTFWFEQCRIVSNERSIRHSQLPLPLAGEGWGGGDRIAGAAS
jgi:hypothetical protein